MNSAFFWDLFLETGAPGMYVYYQEAKRSEEQYVSDSTGTCTASQSI